MKHFFDRTTLKYDYKKQITLRLIMIVLFFVLLFSLIVIKNVYSNAKNEMNAVKNLKLTQMKQSFDFRMDMALSTVENLKLTQEVIAFAEQD